MRLIGVFILIVHAASAQPGWTWTELDTMPFRTSNNAVVEADVNGVKHVFSFGGIDSTKLYSGIHQKSARYNTLTGVWDTIASLPDTLGKIAMGASTVNNIIYIFGGYHVLANGNELSSDRVHRYDPDNNVYLSDGAPIPIPIDDQVQCVWRDSLIYLITGWSNTGNKPWVQIYDPYNDSWQVGTATPVNNNFISFGASGAIVGDTIYYNGGAAGNFSFSSRAYLRKGVIDPLDPSQIVWTQEQDNPGDAGYRMACSTHDNQVFWVAGAGIAYNYDGIAYNGTGGVPPLNRILMYATDLLTWDQGLGAPMGMMDFRGIAKLNQDEWIIAGGMEGNQAVSNRSFLLNYSSASNVLEMNLGSVEVYPVPSTHSIRFINTSLSGVVQIFSNDGKLVASQKMSQNQPIDISQLSYGQYSGILLGKHSKLIFEFIKQ